MKDLLMARGARTLLDTCAAVKSGRRSSLARALSLVRGDVLKLLGQMITRPIALVILAHRLALACHQDPVQGERDVRLIPVGRAGVRVMPGPAPPGSAPGPTVPVVSPLPIRCGGAKLLGFRRRGTRSGGEPGPPADHHVADSSR